jgi:hypothetical protein
MIHRVLELLIGRSRGKDFMYDYLMTRRQGTEKMIAQVLVGRWVLLS